MKLNIQTIMIVVAFLSTSCALDKLATGAIADVLTAPGGNTVFTGDDDPELVADALPFAIKFYESIMEAQPEHIPMRETVGSLYVMYANAFVASPASMLADEAFEQKQEAYKRAKKLYLRANTNLNKGIELAHPGFGAAFTEGKVEAILQKFEKKDVGLLYWFSASWLASIGLDNLDARLTIRLPAIKQLLERALELDGDYGKGGLHDLMTIFYGSMPEGLGLDKAKSEAEHNKTLVLSGGKKAGPYLTWAEVKYLPEQNREAFVALMQKALEIDPLADRSVTLENVLAQKKARYYLQHLDELFWQ